MSIEKNGYSLATIAKRSAFKAAHAGRTSYWSGKRIIGKKHRTFGSCFAVVDPERREMLAVMPVYDDKYSIPGGGLTQIDQIRSRHRGIHGIPYSVGVSQETAEKELYEEAGLVADSVKKLGYLCTSVCDTGLVVASDDIFGGLADKDELTIHMSRSEIASIEWLDMDKLPNNVYHTVPDAVEAFNAII